MDIQLDHKLIFLHFPDKLNTRISFSPLFLFHNGETSGSREKEKVAIAHSWISHPTRKQDIARASENRKSHGTFPHIQVSPSYVEKDDYQSLCMFLHDASMYEFFTICEMQN